MESKRRVLPIVPIPACWMCAHYHDLHAKPFTCAAFPGGIPMDITSYRHHHREAYPGDLDTRFEPVSQKAASYVNFVHKHAHQIVT